METMYPNSCGLDIHKKFLIACVFVLTQSGTTKAVRKRFETTTTELESLVDWLKGYEITHVAMESTGVYWKPVYNILSVHFETWIVNEQHIKQVPGRKTDHTDAEWITKLMRHGLLNRSYIPEEWQRDLRDLTRYRTKLTQEKSSAANRLHKILEDANIKLSSVVTSIQGVSARAMIEALIAEATDAEVIANLAQGKLRKKIPTLVKALNGFVREHHRFMLKEVLEHLDELKQRIQAINLKIQEMVRPYQKLIERLDEIPGVGIRTAEVILAEIGPSVANWPTHRHLASWACICPGNNESGGKRRSGKRRKGQKWLVSALVEAAHAASRTKDTHLSAQFHRLRVRRGAKRAAVAVGHSILTIVYHLIDKPEKRFADLGGDYFLNTNKEREQRRAVKTLNQLGFKVDLQPTQA